MFFFPPPDGTLTRLESHTCFLVSFTVQPVNLVGVDFLTKVDFQTNYRTVGVCCPLHAGSEIYTFSCLSVEITLPV